MIKDLYQVFDEINGTYDNISYKLNNAKSTVGKVHFTTQISSDFFKGVALVTGMIEDSGIMKVFFTFGEVEDTPKLRELINEFNRFAAWAKAYVGTIGDKKHLEIRYSNCLDITDSQAVALFNFFFDDLLSEELVEYVTPMVALTK